MFKDIPHTTLNRILLVAVIAAAGTLAILALAGALDLPAMG